MLCDLEQGLTSSESKFLCLQMETIVPILQDWHDILEKSLIQWYLLSTYYESGTVQGVGEQDSVPFCPHRAHMLVEETGKNQPSCK